MLSCISHKTTSSALLPGAAGLLATGPLLSDCCAASMQSACYRFEHMQHDETKSEKLTSQKQHGLAPVDAMG